MQLHHIPLFKPWVSEWLARTVIFSVLLICLSSFALYSSPQSMTGFYGVEPADVQYAMILTYASVVTFLALDYRMIRYFSSRNYLLTGLALILAGDILCFYTKDWTVFILCGFVQGMACALSCNILLTMIFPRLQLTRARVIGFTIFYGGLQIATPLYSIYTTLILHYLDFNWVYYGLAMLTLGVSLVVRLTMHGKARLHKKLPLYQLDWIGYLFYTFFCLTVGYILVFGQKLNWLDSSLIRGLVFLAFAALLLFISREARLKRPLINLLIFKSRNFIVGLLLLFAFYLFKGTTGLTYGYVETILGTDPLHLIPLWVSVILGTVISMFITSRFLLTGTPLMKLIIAGFVTMALYYSYMLVFISVTGTTEDFIVPMFMYGVATGLLFVPIILFTSSSLPAPIAFNAALVGIFARFAGFCTSIAINNYTQLYTRSAVREKVRESIHETNPQVSLTLQDIQNSYLKTTNDVYTSKEAAHSYFNDLIKEQIWARSTRDYYNLMLVGIIGLIAVLLLVPVVKKALWKWQKGNVPS